MSMILHIKRLENFKILKEEKNGNKYISNL